ncbi:4-hydroxybenzoate octaprenyltransferase [Haliea sp. E1-2-M8]|uniref:4-hydroxybenzoate octaprenyltransferase n=1 Tax=Haliea sp. E1-2-M8 TaxID=3064706 RepID=UPI00272904AF|nr:4-hydroxybenzoate octaprenyltransferase [Haliea sp. E1-2-M8]MDO8860154.1 4-hydroxybenzoate octaprenyltransferase [Haliea sp. E1-2-M8]
MRQRVTITALLQLMRIDKPIGTLLLLWPTLWALWIAAGGVPDTKLLLIFVFGTFLMRSAGCIVNDLADRHWDGSVERTRTRPLVTGEVTVTQARILFLLLCLAAFGLVLLTNTLTIVLSVGGLLLASTYPFMKRFTYWPQVVLGAAFSWAIPMAFAAQQGELPSALWLLYLGNLLWTMVFDTQYAMVDRDDDLRAGIKSTAILFGDADRAVLGAMQLLCLLALFLAGQRFGLGGIYYLSLVAVALLFGYHQYLIRSRDRDACFRAFRHNNWVGLVIFMGIALHYAFNGH